MSTELRNSLLKQETLVVKVKKSFVWNQVLWKKKKEKKNGEIEKVIETFSSWDQGQIGIELRTKYVIYQKLANFLQKKYIYMLTGLIVSSLVCKCVFYRPEHNAKRRLYRIEF